MKPSPTNRFSPSPLICVASNCFLTLVTLSFPDNFILDIVTEEAEEAEQLSFPTTERGTRFADTMHGEIWRNYQRMFHPDSGKCCFFPEEDDAGEYESERQAMVVDAQMHPSISDRPLMVHP